MDKMTILASHADGTVSVTVAPAALISACTLPSLLSELAGIGSGIPWFPGLLAGDGPGRR
jgi:hypothetical protein